MDLRSKFSWLPSAGLEIGMYDEALKKGLAFGEWLEGLKAEKEGTSPYQGMTQMETIKAKRAQRMAGKVPIPTAFDQLLSNFNLNIGGAASEKLGKFFQYSGSEVLMGEYISQVVAASLIGSSHVGELVAFQERTNASDFRRYYLEDTGDDLETGELSYKQELPDLWIKVGDRSMRLIKYGRYLNANFDDVDNVTFQAFNIALNRVGMQIGVGETSEAIRIGVKGDGNSNAAATFNPATTATIVVADVINMSDILEDPYTPTHIVAKKTQMNQYKAAVVGIPRRISLPKRPR